MMHEVVFVLMVWTLCLASIVINKEAKDRLGKVLWKISILAAVIDSVGVVLVLKGVIP